MEIFFRVLLWLHHQTFMFTALFAQVQEQTDMAAGCLQVIQQLRFMLGIVFFLRFDLDNHFVIYEQGGTHTQEPSKLRTPRQ
jgi:hypothetical protein